MDSGVETVLPHPTYVYCCQWIESNDKLLLVTGGYDGTIRCWNMNQVIYKLLAIIIISHNS